MASRSLTAACLLALGLGAAGTANAQTPLEELSACVTVSASDADRGNLVRWLFAALAVHPELKALARIEEAERATIDRTMAQLLQRLVTEDCVAHVRQLEPAQLQGAFEVAFRALGEQAGMAAMSHPDVLVANQGLLRHLDPTAFQRVFQEQDTP